MKQERAGMLERSDPLYRFLIEAVMPEGGSADFEVFHLNGIDGSVYLYVDQEHGTRIVGKFYGRKLIPDASAALRSLLVRREFDNLAMLRANGFGSAPHLVPQPLATAEEINWLLVEEFVEGVNLHHVIWQNVFAGGRLLPRILTVTAELLARLHRCPTPSELLPQRDRLRYIEKILSQLRNAGIIGGPETERLEHLARRWEDSDALETTAAMIHGDATPEHFFYDEPERRMHMIDVESLRHGDPAEDLGYLAGEIKHLCWWYSGNLWFSEPYIQHFYAAYASAAGLSDASIKRLTERARYFMGCAELRIARNAWLSPDYRKTLAAEAELCLKM